MLQSVPRTVAVAELTARLQQPTSRGLALAVSPGDSRRGRGARRSTAAYSSAGHRTRLVAHHRQRQLGIVPARVRSTRTDDGARPSLITGRRRCGTDGPLQGPATFALDLSSGIPDRRAAT